MWRTINGQNYQVVDSNSHRKTQKVKQHKNKILGLQKHCPILTTNILLSLQSRLLTASLSAKIITLIAERMARNVILHIHLPRYQRKSLIITCQACFLFGLPMKDEDCDLPLLYWIPKLHKCSYRQRQIAEVSKCSNNPLSKILTSICTVVKTGLQKYHNTCFLGVALVKCGY